MANVLTYAGQDIAFYGSGSDGSIARVAAKLKLFTSASVIDRAVANGGLVEVGGGTGYTVGGIAITRADWTAETDAGNRRIRLANKTWTAAGGSIANIAGAYITDAADVVLAIWERTSPITIASGDTFTAQDLFIKPT